MIAPSDRRVAVRVSGKVMVVTGGGAGIGRQVVLELLRRGARVAAVDLRADGLAGTVDLAAAGERLMTVEADVTDAAAIAALPERVAATLGPVDGVVHVAGIIQPFVRLKDLDDAAIRRVLAVNLDGTLNVDRAFLPGLLSRPEAHLVNVASMGAYLPVPGQTVYGASKAAVKLLTEGLYAECIGTGVEVSLVLPGAVATDITANSGVAIPGGAAAAEEPGRSFPTTSAEDAARIVVDGMEAGRLHIYVGRDAKLMNLLSRIAPRRAVHLIEKQMRSLLG
jgi:NAD(P)-dependent dehydrogenase (short-subunit alcohol dehydrogenase family)